VTKQLKIAAILNFSKFRKPLIMSICLNAIHLYNGQARSILIGSSKDWIATPQTLEAPYFNEFMPINNASFVFRYVSSKTGNNTLRKQSLTGYFDNDGLLLKQVDGLFCTSGMLAYNKTLHKLLYLYFPKPDFGN
jgi:hypothetical protein